MLYNQTMGHERKRAGGTSLWLAGWPEHLLVLGLFGLLSAIMTWPLVTLLDQGINMHGDAVLQLTTITWDAHALFTDPLHLFDAPFFYPYYHTLALSDHLIGETLLTYPLIVLSGNPVLGLNVYKFCTFILSGYGIYLLVRDTVGSKAAGLLAGAAFTFTNFRFLELSHVNILAMEWFPLTLWSLRRGLVRNSARWMGFAGLFFLMMALCSVYYMYFLAIAVGGYLAWWSLAWLLSGGRLRVSKSLLSSRPCRLLITWTPILAAVLLLYLPYIQLNAELGAYRSVSEVQNWSATWSYFIQVLPTNVLWAGLFPQMSTVTGERMLFPGLVMSLLAVVGVLTWRVHLASRNALNATTEGYEPPSGERWYWLVLGLGAFVLTFGLSYPLPDDLSHIPLPYALLYDRLPGFHALRVPTRFIVLVDLALAVFAGWGVQAIRAGLEKLRLQSIEGNNRLRFRGALPAALWTLALLAILGESAQALDLRNNRQMRVPQSELYSWYQWLAENGSGPVIEFPFKANTDEAWYSYFDTYYWLPLVDGWSSFTPPGITYLSRALRQFPDEASVALLQGLEVKYILIHVSDYSELQGAAIREKLSAIPALTLRHDDEGHRVYELASNPWLRRLGERVDIGSGRPLIWFSGEIDEKRNVRHPEMETLAYFAIHRLGWEGVHGDVPTGYRPLPPLPAGAPADYIVQPGSQAAPEGYVEAEQNPYAVIYRRSNLASGR